MALPELTKQMVDKVLGEYCADKVPAEYRDKIKVIHIISGNNVTLYEERPLFTNPTKWTRNTIAQFRYNAVNREWTLCWRDRNSRWHVHPDLAPTPDFKVLLKEVNKDPTGIFWG